MQSDDGDERTLKKRRESNRLCAQRRRARQKRQIEDLQEEAFGLTQDNERLRSENTSLRRLVQEELLISQNLRQRSVANTLPLAAPRFNFPPTLPMTSLPYPFNNPLALDEYISNPRPAFVPNIAATSAAATANRDLSILLPTLGLPGASQLLQRHTAALGESSYLNDRAEFPLPTGSSAFASAAAPKSPKDKVVLKGNPKRRRGSKESSSDDDDDDDEAS